MSPAVVELASGVDALYLSGRAVLPNGLLERLKASREAAEEEHCGIPFDFGCEEFELAQYPFGKYRYCLKHPHGQLGLSPSAKLPAIRIQPRAQFLHAIEPRWAVEWFADILEAEVGPLRLSVSRVDLFADVQGWSPCIDDRSRFVCRADVRTSHENGEEFNGLSFGRRKSGTMTARIYDKTIESKLQGTDYWPDIWGANFDPNLPVIRVEFEFSRQALREFGLDSPSDVLASNGALWASATTDWLSFRSPTDDQTRSRWPIAPEWQAIQHASIRQRAAGLDRVAQGQRDGSLRNMLPQLNGWVVSFAALMGTSDLHTACEMLRSQLRDYEDESDISFASRVTRRRHEQAIE